MKPVGPIISQEWTSSSLGLAAKKDAGIDIEIWNLFW